MPAEYEIIGQQRYTYLDDLNRVVNGYRISFKIAKTGEVDFVDVPNNAPQTVRPAVEAAVKNRLALMG